MSRELILTVECRYPLKGFVRVGFAVHFGFGMYSTSRELSELSSKVKGAGAIVTIEKLVVRKYWKVGVRTSAPMTAKSVKATTTVISISTGDIMIAW